MTSDPSPNRLQSDTAIDADLVVPPVADRTTMPEKILQFGTGAFLRGFSNVFVDRANRNGIFNGRIVAVGSTGSGRSRLINDQDGLYTLAVQGVDGDETVDRCTVVSSLSRAIASTDDWPAVMAVARSPDLEVVVSNTTEVGIRFDSDDRPDLDPPRSFPGKLAVLLRERAEAFDYAPSSGLTILCCELIEANGDRLREIVLQLAEMWSFEEAFLDWVRLCNVFCNTLVDRIVPGTPSAPALEELEMRIGYRDPLLVQAEPFYFWAIEGNADTRKRLGFVNGDPEIVITPDITPYRLRKVRVLNGAHSVVVPLSYLCGNDTVAQTMAHPLTRAFLHHVVLEEIVPSLEGELEDDDAETFARQVMDRLANPFVQHELLNIALHQTSKMDVRVLPSLAAYVAKIGQLPEGILLGFAAFLMFAIREGRAAEAELPTDEKAGRVRVHWAETGPSRLGDFVQRVAEDRDLWHHSLETIPGFCDRVAGLLHGMLRDGVQQTLEAFIFAKNGQRT